MSPNRALAFALLLAAAFLWGVLHLFGVEFAAGDVYPEYSSMRTDPAGSRLLFDSLARIPGVTAARNYLPLESLKETRATIILLGLDPASFSNDPQAIKSAEACARRGNRIVIAMAMREHSQIPLALVLRRSWDVDLRLDPEPKHIHKLYFAENPAWTVLDRVGNKILAMERSFGSGSVVLFAESQDFINEATVAADRLEILSAAIGPNSRVIFDEAHLGIAETGSVVGLARRFRLTGMALGIGLVALLFVWKNAAGFPPPAAARDTPRFSGRTAHSGLLTLLRRHISPRELAAACWQEWLRYNRRTVPPQRIEEAGAILHDPANQPVDAIRKMQAILWSKGAL